MCDLTGWTVEWSGDVLVGTHQDGRRLSLGEVDGSRWWLLDPASGLRWMAGHHETQPHVAAERQVIARGGHVGPACLPGPDLRRWRLAQGLSTRALASQLQQWLPARTVASIAATLSQVEREEYPAPGYLRAAIRARIDQPSKPARAPESSTPEEAPARASVVAAQPGSGELGGVASPGAGAPQAADRTREPELGGAYPPPAADPPCSPLSRPSGDSSTAAPAADRADPRADREGGGSGASAGLTLEIAEAIRRHGELRRVRAEAAAQQARADAGSLYADLQLVRESLDRLGVPAGELGWRLGWLEGRQGGGR